MLICRQSADFVRNLNCFLGLAGNKKIITDLFFLDRPTVFGTWQTVFSPPTICRHQPVIGRRSADTPPTSIFKLNHSDLADSQPIIGRQSAE